VYLLKAEFNINDVGAVGAVSRRFIEARWYHQVRAVHGREN
jgi:hypothetical protein